MKKEQKRILLLLAGILLLLLLILAGVSYQQEQRPAAAFEIPPFETQAGKGIPEIPEEALDYRMFEIGEGIRVGLCGNIKTASSDEDGSETGGKAWVYFTSDSGNTVWLKMVLLNTENEKIGESGLLLPGEYVEEIALDSMPEETSEVTVRILSYEPETYYSMGSAAAKVRLEIENAEDR